MSQETGALQGSREPEVQEDRRERRDSLVYLENQVHQEKMECQALEGIRETWE